MRTWGAVAVVVLVLACGACADDGGSGPSGEQTTFCPADGMFGPGGTELTRDPDKGCRFVDEDGNLATTDAAGQPICYGEAAAVVPC